MNCPFNNDCSANALCYLCRAQVNSNYFQRQDTQTSAKSKQQSQIIDQGFNNVNKSQLDQNVNQPPANQDQNQNQNPPAQQNGIPQPQPQLINQGQNQPPNQNQPQLQQNPPRNQQMQDQILQYINFKLDIYPQHKFSISQNPTMITHLYSLNFHKLFQNVVDYSHNLIKNQYYQFNPACKVNSTTLNDITNIQKLNIAKPNKFSQFFHSMNIIMSSTYFICSEQAIQHSIVNLRKPELLELALSKNKMFDIDNFRGVIHDESYENYKLRKYDCKSKFQLLDQNQMEGKLLDFLQNSNISPILIWTVDNENQEFIVVKQNQGFWYFLSNDSQTFKITKNSKNYISDLSDSVEELNQFDFIRDYFGAINIFYEVRACNQNERKVDKTLHNMFHLIYQQKSYQDINSFWANFKLLAEQQLKLPDIQNNKFALPQLRHNPTNYYSYQNTQNQAKKQKKARAKNSKQSVQDSEEIYEEDTSNSSSDSPIKMITRKQKAKEEELENKRQKKG
ncbi:hypothetical protein OXYTRIMIC_218 [Oxytricha trifallax]|uniref:Uncharacterized protein n=1 Tax=Oxytricha trifallax TaxID=1172189 RepID=A0A073HWL3_9SPIT|nr:hypothetical protein OXYTRIMIC_218 [Oxytricha trifallax]